MICNGFDVALTERDQLHQNSLSRTLSRSNREMDLWPLANTEGFTSLESLRHDLASTCDISLGKDMVKISQSLDSDFEG